MSMIQTYSVSGIHRASYAKYTWSAEIDSRKCTNGVNPESTLLWNFDRKFVFVAVPSNPTWAAPAGCRLQNLVTQLQWKYASRREERIERLLENRKDAEQGICRACFELWLFGCTLSPCFSADYSKMLVFHTTELTYADSIVHKQITREHGFRHQWVWNNETVQSKGTNADSFARKILLIEIQKEPRKAVWNLFF